MNPTHHGYGRIRSSRAHSGRGGGDTPDRFARCLARCAVRIGLVPRLVLPRIISAGNVAGEGAKMALLSMQERHAATAMLKEVEYVELSDREDFNDRFIEQLAFPAVP